VTLATKYSILGDITQSFHELAPSEEQVSLYQSWYNDALQSLLDSDTKTEEGDGSALAKIVETCGPCTDVSQGVNMRLDNMSTAAIATFVLPLVPPGAPMSSGLTRYVKDVLQKLWSSFHYYPDLRCDQLCDLLELTQKNQAVPIHTVLQKIYMSLSGLREWAGLSEDTIYGRERPWKENKLTDYLKQVLVPFVGRVINQQVAGLSVAHNHECFEILSPYIASVICAYITRAVAAEPKPPTTWALEKAGCKQCELCENINNFMVDGHKQVCMAHVTEIQKQHLASYSYVYGEHRSFNVEVLPLPEQQGKFLWTMTKEHKKFKRELNDWQKRQDEAKMLLRCIGGGKDMVLLRTYLGDNFDTITSCQVELLPKVFNSIIDKQPDEPATPEKLPAYTLRRKTAHQKQREHEVMEDREEEMFMLQEMGMI